MVDDAQQLMTYTGNLRWKKIRRFRSNLYVFDSLKAFTDDGAALNGNRELNEN